MIIDWATERAVREVRAADTAARAARAVPGVVRLQPGVWGLVRQLGAQAFERVTGHGVPDIAGVDVELVGDDAVGLDLRIVVDGRHRAATVGAAVRHAVSTTVPPEHGFRVVSVAVHVVEVQLP